MLPMKNSPRKNQIIQISSCKQYFYDIQHLKTFFIYLLTYEIEIIPTLSKSDNLINSAILSIAQHSTAIRKGFAVNDGS